MEERDGKGDFAIGCWRGFELQKKLVGGYEIIPWFGSAHFQKALGNSFSTCEALFEALVCRNTWSNTGRT